MASGSGAGEAAFAEMLFEDLGVDDPIRGITLERTVEIGEQYRELAEDVPWVVDMGAWDQEAMTLLRALSVASGLAAGKVWSWLCAELRTQVRKSRAWEVDMGPGGLAWGAPEREARTPEPPLSLLAQVGFKYDVVWHKFLREIWGQETLQSTGVWEKLEWGALPDWATLGEALVVARGNGSSLVGGGGRRFAVVRNGVLWDVVSTGVLEMGAVALIGPMTRVKEIQRPSGIGWLGSVLSGSIYGGSLVGGSLSLSPAPPAGGAGGGAVSGSGYARGGTVTGRLPSTTGKSSMSFTIDVDTSEYEKSLTEAMRGFTVARGGIQYGTHSHGGAIDIRSVGPA